MSSVELAGVRFRYRGGEREALSGVDFRSEAGERVAIIGLTAAGKSTLLKCLNRLVPASQPGEFQGRVLIDGEDISGLRPAQMAPRVGMVFQDFESQLFGTTAEQDVAFGPENLGLSAEEIRRRVDEALKAAGMEEFRRRNPTALSGGQKQRLAIASVLALESPVLCLDEPTTDLDPRARAEVREVLGRLAGAGRTIIIAEHEPELIEQADRVVGLHKGKVVFEGTREQAFQDPELLASLGVRPPDLCALFHRLGLPERPSDPETARDLLLARGFRLRKSRPEDSSFPDQRKTSQKPEAAGSLLIADSISYNYPGGVSALQEATLSVNRGDFLVILGMNGSGKTTLVKHLNGLLRPSEGAVFFEGKDVREMKVAELGRRTGFVFQDPDHQIFASRVFDEVAFAPRNHGISGPELERRVSSALAAVGLSGFEDRDPFLLTKGERQRVALASVLSAEPEVIIMDEPTTGLDYPSQRAVLDLLARLNREGRTIIIITHALWVAAEYASAVAIMAGGKVLRQGPPPAVLSDLDLLSAAGLSPPAITRLGLLMGRACLSVDEFIGGLEKRGEP